MTTDRGPYPAEYPVQFAVEYPDRPLNRLTSFFRIAAAALPAGIGTPPFRLPLPRWRTAVTGRTEDHGRKPTVLQRDGGLTSHTSLTWPDMV
jgi:hypothetical protein